MSANDADIRVRIAGDIADINKAIQELRREVRAAGKDAANSNRDWNVLGRGLEAIRNGVGGIVAGYLSFRTVQSIFRAIIQNTREAEDVQAQLEARVRSTGQVAGFTAEQLLGLASDLQTVTAFGDEAIAQMQSVLLMFTRIRGENFEVATERALDMATALRTDLQSAALQVGKALNDPIRGVTALSRAGVQFTNQQRELIKQLVETGDVAGAQRVILGKLETQFGGAARAARGTLGGALDSLRNALGDLLEGDDATLQGLVDGIEQLIELLRDPAVQQGFGLLVQGTVRLTGAAATFASEFAFLGHQIGETAAQVAGNVTEIDRLEAEIRNVDRAMRSSFLGRPIALLGKSREELAAMREDLERALVAAREAQAGGPLVAPGAPAAPAVEAPALVDARPALRDLQAQLAAAGTLLEDELKRLRTALDREFEQNLVSFAEYFRRRSELETRAIDQQIEMQRTALRLLDEEIRLAGERQEDAAEQEEQRAKLIAEITALERQRGDIATNAARAQADAERQLVEQLEQVRIRLQELQGDAAGARSAELEREFRDLLARLQAEGDAEGEALVRRLIDVEVARTRLGEIEDEYERTLARLSRAERRVELQVETGLISEREGRRRIIELHRQTADEVEKLIPLMQELAVATGDPAALERLEELKLEIEELRSTTETFAKEARETIHDAGADAFSSWLDGSRKAKDAWRDFIDDIRRRIADFLADRAMERLLAILTGGGGGQGGGGGIGTFFRSLFAGVQHEGGIAGFARQWRRVPALAFAGAPRLHDGGLALRPGEVPAILQRGEEVLTRRDPRHRDNVGALPMIGEVTIVTRDAQSFRRLSPGQIGAQLATDIIRARNRNG